MSGHEGASGEITMKEAIEKIESANVKTRTDGLDDLKHIFKNRTNPKLALLKDKAYHPLFERLFRILLSDKASYLGSKGKSTPAVTQRHANRLSGTANALRVLVEVGAPTLKQRTAKSVIHHVIDTLPCGDGEYCFPLSQEYFRTLRAILSHKPHAENLARETWESVVVFCTDGIDCHYEDGRESSVSRSNSFAGDSAESSRRTVPISQAKSSSSRVGGHSRNIEDLLNCLHAVVSIPHAPLVEHRLRYDYARRIASSVMHVIQDSQAPSLNISHQVALSIMKLVLSSVMADQTALCKDLAIELVPVITRLWPTKLMSAKDEMLSILLTVHLHLESVLVDNQDETLETDIRHLSEVLKAEYSNRLGRDQLQLEDVEMAALERSITTTAPLNLLRLRPHNLRAERNWMLLTALGILDHLGILKERTASIMDPAEDGDDGAPYRKRRRIATHIDNLTEALNRPMPTDASKRLTALQALPFLLQITQLPKEGLTKLLECLSGLVSASSGNLASWAILGLASCTNQNALHSSNFQFDWIQIWHVVGRLVTSSNHCRAACHLLHALLAKGFVKYHDIAEDVTAMITSPESSGPILLADSSLSLMTHLLQVRNMEVPRASSVTSHNVVRWAFTKFNPIDSVERNSSTTMIHLSQPIDFVNLLRACLSMPRLKLPISRITPCTPIGQSWHRVLASETTIRYLLLLGEVGPAFKLCPTCPAALELHDLKSCADTNSHVQSLRKTILELCLPKFEALALYWDTSAAEVPNHISNASVVATISAFLFGSHVVSLLGDLDVRSLPELKQCVESLGRTAISFTHCPGPEGQKYDEVLLQSLHSYLPCCKSLECDYRPSSDDSIFLKFIILYAAEIEDRSAAKGSSIDRSNDGDDDMMLMEDEFDGRQRDFNFDPMDDLPREELSLATSTKAFNISTSVHVVLLKTLATSQTEPNSVPSAFLDYLLSLPEVDALLCRNFLQDLLQSKLVLNDDEATRLLEHYAVVLGKSAYGRCEIVQGDCLLILTKTATTWASNEESAGHLMHQWLDRCLEKDGFFSSTIMIDVAKLQLHLIELHLRPSTSRSNLLKVLWCGENRVKFYIGARLPEVFRFHVLQEHAKILDEVVDKLPADPDYKEGIAFRMHVFALLASKWPTLIRRSVYHIFECPGRFPECSDHAARCFSHVSAALGLGSARELFHLFASQLLFTWLESDHIEQIPFRTLGYDNLIDLVRDMQVDITALMMMRAQTENLDTLTKLLGQTRKDLIQQSFAKVVAYTTAYDITMPTAGNVPKGEMRIRTILGGKTEYLDYMNTHFVEVIALLFCVIEQDERIDKLFTKTEQLIAAGVAMKEMKSISSSQILLPPNQQPAFKVRHLATEIDFICSRTQREHSQIYTPAMVSFIARKLFDLAHPALGPLHTCAVLRKVRILIAIAGSSALEGYPLEMLLQSFRPYLTDPECVEDAIGVVQYLFIHGSAHLSKSPSFVSGIALSTLASLRVFLKSSQPSTTEDSRHQAIISRAADFHQWLVDYLKNYKSPTLRHSARKLFQDILDAARSIQTAGNAGIGTPESTLLTCLLEDERCSNPLMNRPSRDLAFSLLCNDFNPPSCYQKDVFGTDEAASKYAAAIWNLCRSTSVSKDFLAWGAKVVGRAFAASGHIHDELLRESEITRIKALSKPEEVHSRSSSSLLRLLQALTLGNDHQEVGLAESTLRFVLSSLEGPEELTDLQECQQCLSESIYEASSWGSLAMPPSDIHDPSIEPNVDPFSAEAINRESWLGDLSVRLCVSVTSNAVLSSLPRLLRKIKKFAEEAFPFVLHLVLADQLEGKPTVKKELSAALRHWLNSEDNESRRNVKLLLNAILYLRTQPLPDETCHADRSKWLDIDYSDAAKAALRCSMYKTALLFTEISSDTVEKSSRRSSAVKSLISPDLLLAIFRSIDDPDSFYGVQQDSSLSSVLSRLEYEKDGFKSLSFRGAQYDSNVRRKDPAASSDAESLVNTLGILRFDGLSHSLVSAKQTVGMSAESRESMFRTARKLEQWDIPVPETSSNDAATIYRAFQTLNNAADHKTIMAAVDDGLSTSMKTLVGENLDATTLHSSLQSLSILTEMSEMLSSDCSVAFEEAFDRYKERMEWMKTGRFDDISHIISCRETLLSSLSQRNVLRELLKIDVRDTRLVEIRTTLISSQLSRAHGALQESLASTTYMTGLIHPCHDAKLEIAGAVNLETANSLWELGEMTSSIGLLKELVKTTDLERQDVPVSKSDLLAKLGYQVSTARLEMPDKIIENYLQPALAALKGRNTEKESGQVYHEFAVFCDQQLQDPDGLEDFERLRKLREGRQREVDDITRLIKTGSKKHANSTKDWPKALDKAKKWYQLDNQEYSRLSASREGFLEQSLENYLLALTASDDYNRDAVRFLTMWLQNSDVQFANKAVAHHLSKVPTRKFALLMNQLTSRLADQDELFQKLLSRLVTGICTDHPYHGMYQIWAATMYGQAKDGAGIGRKTAATRIAKGLKTNPLTSTVWDAIDKTNRQYCTLAADNGSKSQRGKSFKANSKCTLTDFVNGKTFISLLTKEKIPPCTMHIEIAASRDYNNLPVTSHVEPAVSIASGLSVPKIITLRASNGQKFKQLVKGGNDDLRQDAIMEQVFTQVSEILKTDRSTRQRNLQIRTYKIIPLTSIAGVIEFVPNSIPLGEFLPSAHSRYYPKDISVEKCRNMIHSVTSRTPNERIKVFREVTEKFHPVMRYFFIERFDDPDDWFAKRLNYTRSTAANSMLGHVLGLGDRHQHNILMDEETGEVVHIDFGFAFETGRVLPVPETIPFRLTRDIIDGMGITGTEGVFRRCCEFTLAALRKEIYSIMAVLDVLRYDPLYSWTISPARQARVQNEQAAIGDDGDESVGKTEVEKDGKDDLGEAERALMVVRKKLSKTLSVEATVNDLINQATNERNLALLFHGWAAYA